MIAGGSRCAFAGPDCEGRLEWHHCLTKNRLKRMFPYGGSREPGDRQWYPISRLGPGTQTIPLTEILGDARNRVWLCSHHHELVTNGRLKVELPESVWEFAREFGLAAQLENDIARAA